MDPFRLHLHLYYYFQKHSSLGLGFSSTFKTFFKSLLGWTIYKLQLLHTHKDIKCKASAIEVMSLLNRCMPIVTLFSMRCLTIIPPCQEWSIHIEENLYMYWDQINEKIMIATMWHQLIMLKACEDSWPPKHTVDHSYCQKEGVKSKQRLDWPLLRLNCGWISQTSLKLRCFPPQRYW